MEDRMKMISEKTPMQIGLIVLILGLVVAIFSGLAGGVLASVWWGGVTQTKLENLQKSLDGISTRLSVFDISLSKIETRVQIIEATGSNPLRLRLDVIDKELVEIRRRMEQHILLDDAPKPKL